MWRGFCADGQSGVPAGAIGLGIEVIAQKVEIEAGCLEDVQDLVDRALAGHGCRPDQHGALTRGGRAEDGPFAGSEDIACGFDHGAGEDLMLGGWNMDVAQAMRGGEPGVACGYGLAGRFAVGAEIDDGLEPAGRQGFKIFGLKRSRNCEIKREPVGAGHCEAGPRKLCSATIFAVPA